MQPRALASTTSSSPTSVMLVEDDRRLAELVSDTFTSMASPCSTSHAATSPARSPPARAGAGVLDLMLPGPASTCRQIRSFSDVPILMLTACEDDIEQVLGLGRRRRAQAHRTTPASGPAARRCRRHGSSNTGTPSRLMHGELLIDRMQREVHLHGATVDVGTTEFEILWLLASQPGRSCPVTRSCRRCAVSASTAWTAALTSASASAASSATMRAADQDRAGPRLPVQSVGLDGMKRLFLWLWFITALWHRIDPARHASRAGPAEQAAVQADGFIVRDQYQQVLLPIDRWSLVCAPWRVQMTTYMTIAAHLSILLLVGASLYAGFACSGAIWRPCACMPTASAPAIWFRHARRSGSSSITPTAWPHAWPNWCSASAT